MVSLDYPVFLILQVQRANLPFSLGKHDVGSLSRSQGRHASFTRSSVRGHSHGPGPPPASSIFSHAHGHPLRPEHTKESQRSRRGGE